MAQRLIRVMGIILVLTLLLAIATLARPVQAGEVVTAPMGSNELPGESVLISLLIVIGAVLLAAWMWLEKMWRFIPS